MQYGSLPRECKGIAARTPEEFGATLGQVDPRELWFSQQTTSVKRLLEYHALGGHWDPVIVCRFDGKCWLVNGHHRSMVALLSGERQLDAWIIEL